MKKLALYLRISLQIGLGLLCLLLLFLFSSWCFAPGKSAIQAAPEETAALEEDLARLKDQSIDPKNVMRIQVPVDYGEGKSAAWYPKQEPPILQSLVEAGELPPVHQRVPEEPLVLKGLHGKANYGGTMYRINGFAAPRLEPIQLVRFSPQGFPIVPNLAKSWTITNGGRTYTFKLRKGTKWSDGHPFTSTDIMYWWIHEQNDIEIRANGPDPFCIHRGKPMDVSAPDPLTIVFAFADPYYLFLEELASVGGLSFLNSPAHYMKDYHPVIGDKAKIQDVMQRHSLINERAVYSYVGGRIERPRLTPWIPKTERASPPETMVRNPYYWAVDPEGRQLPYVDRIVSNQKSRDMLVISVAQGEVTAQARYVRNKDYTMLMRQRKDYGYQVHHWLNGDGSDWAISFNMNRRVPQGDRESKDKARLLDDKRFRQALSLATDRQTIIESLFGGMGKPLSIGPVAPSPFEVQGAGMKFLRFDRDAANRLLDACGLTERDRDGYRRFPGGPDLLFDINYCEFTGEGPGEFIIEDWRNVGIRARLRGQDRTILYTEKYAGLHDMTVWIGYGAYFPLLDLRYYFPCSDGSNFAVKNGAWYYTGGLFKPASQVRGVKPAEDHPFYKAMLLNEELKQTATLTGQRDIFAKILKIAEEEVYVLNIYAPLPYLGIVKNGFSNVPTKGVYSWVFQSPGNLGLETWCYDTPEMTPGESKDILGELTKMTPLRTLHGNSIDTSSVAASSASDSRSAVSTIIRYGLLMGFLLLLTLCIIRFPFIGQRLVIMVPTLIIISIISFIIIELPPGDAITSKIMTLEEDGGQVDPRQIEEIKDLFRTEEPAWKRYTWWVGLDWFFSFEGRDEGLLQGNMGRSMIDLQPVNRKVGDRLLFTFLISLGTILFTWAIAFPIGIYSAVRQYSLFDYIFTVVGFIGMCIPGFLLALLLMFASESWLGLNVSGLFSPEYAVQTGWSTGKVLDLLSHLWLPILVQGISGTGGMIRVMRANLLDELKKPYVTTARAKGVRPLKLLFKYPVRIALNPFISGIGGLFPALISGGAIVAIVMSLPTIGPMQLDAVMCQDMYLAGSMLMVLSLLSVLGTLFSDIMLLILDPRIRITGGAK